MVEASSVGWGFNEVEATVYNRPCQSREESYQACNGTSIRRLHPDFSGRRNLHGCLVSVYAFKNEANACCHTEYKLKACSLVKLSKELCSMPNVGF